MLSHVRLLVTPWTVAHQTPLSMGPSRQEYLRELPFPTPGDLPNPGFEPVALVYHAFECRLFTIVPPGKPKVGLKRRECFLISFVLEGSSWRICNHCFKGTSSTWLDRIRAHFIPSLECLLVWKSGLSPTIHNWDILSVIMNCFT